MGMENLLNIVNFIRGAEPRRRWIDLVEPVREQIRLMKENHLKGTFLVQYDAMLREDILSLLRPLDPEQFELGIWLEMNQPHVEAAGLKWRGRPGFEWDWHANVGFSVGYLPEERERLVDVIFEKFRECFGREARSVGSWMIDAHTLAYMADKYGIVASCNCKDQWGTDGYTIWGGYWNQAYYPSRKNALCPAQTAEGGVPVPVFRMLGSDPVSQYDLGLSVENGATELQGVESLEPVYEGGGGRPAWVDWFMRQNFRGGSLAFAYAQAGQENSFGWPAMKKGLEYQFPLFAKMRDEGALRVERLADSGEWFMRHFQRTPATAVCALEPYEDRQAQSIWYDCVNYRANLYCDGEGLRLRDLTLFDERCEERYLRAACETEYLVYENLPIVDGNRMSGGGIRAGAWLCAEGIGSLTATEEGEALRVGYGAGELLLTPDGLQLTGSAELCFRWRMDKRTLVRVDGRRLIFAHDGGEYALRVDAGEISGCDAPTIRPEKGRIALSFERVKAGTNA